MKASTREWVKKAESDYQLAVSLVRRRKVPVRDHVCFHFQQAAEKYIKARLEEANVRFPKTHDVELLVQIATAIEPLWAALAAAGKQLSDYAVRIRYPGNEASAQEMKTAYKHAKVIRHEARASLGL
ncbi:MAG: HEPN domain-containing protein [Prosthecobacter sp.]|uniref:HEPN domain-containing protein n=1 Tax=Prosthecobacter sp. TaxID=1965333 RepID=UPI003903D847